jgi:hypothetical protein
MIFGKQAILEKVEAYRTQITAHRHDGRSKMAET